MHILGFLFCVCVCVRACVRACVCVCVCARARARARACDMGKVKELATVAERGSSSENLFTFPCQVTEVIATHSSQPPQ